MLNKQRQGMYEKENMQVMKGGLLFSPIDSIFPFFFPIAHPFG
jgi:hypothetical protein